MWSPNGSSRPQLFKRQGLKEAETIFQRLETEAHQELLDQGFSPKEIAATRFLHLRYHGTDTAIMIARPEDNDYAKAFRAVYRREFGFDLAGREILIDDIRIRARGKAPGLQRINVPKAQGPPQAVDTAQCCFENGPRETLIYDLEKLAAGHCITGPAILIHHTSTILIEPDCIAAITPNGDVEIKVGAGTVKKTGTTLDPVQLSIFSNLFMSIAEQMGRMLQKPPSPPISRSVLIFPAPCSVPMANWWPTPPTCRST